MARSKNRLLLFKILSGILISIVLLALVTKLYDLFTDFKEAPGTDAYALNESINQRNQDYSQGNPYGFTDKKRPLAKPKGVYRIAVLGDSFIWGDGLPYEQAWSHKLEKKLLASYDSLEVLHWGRCGWSTLDEINFYKRDGKDYTPDLLIIGWVDNDPDIGKYSQVSYTDPAKDYPFAFKIAPWLAKRWENEKNKKAYNIWLANLYASDNLNEYRKLLSEFRSYLAEQNTDVIFVMTPGPFNDLQKQHFDMAEPLLRGCNYKCLNLYQPMEKKLGSYSGDQLRANPVNGHPGVLMTEEFSTEVLGYLYQNGYLQHVPKLTRH